MKCPLLFLALFACLITTRADGVYDLKAIQQDPLDAKTLSSEVIDGIVVEHVEFNGDRAPDGSFIRLTGIVAYPQGGKGLPGLLWCQGGIGDAQPFFPTLFAKKGYLCIHLTLAKKQWNAYGKFDAAHPADANLVRLAWEQMRGVTYIAGRPEVDASKLGVGGASYGGVFSTMVAGIDPRIKAGMSFFGAGNHQLGTNLPQFTRLANLDEIEVFRQNADGATFISKRDIPFIWGLPTNDNWFFFPAVVETYRQKPGVKRLAIVPHWVHGFPPEVDQELFDWFDVYLKGTRAPYLQPGPLTISREGGKLIASWSWTGTEKPAKAALLVSYGRVLPWHGWRHRYYHTVPATIDGQTARAEIPVPETKLPMVIFGNVWDTNQVLVSTDPVYAVPLELGIEQPNASPVTNGCPRGRLEAEDTTILTGTAQAFGRPDSAVFHGGSQSVAIDPPEEGVKRRRPRNEVRLMLYNVYERNHRLTLWLKADQPMTVDVTVQGQYPANWEMPAVKAILATMPEAASIPAKADIPAFKLAAALTTEWQEFTVDVPFTSVAVEGYDLLIDRRAGDKGTYWIDDVDFRTVWPGQAAHE